MLDIDSLKSKAKNLAKQKATSFFDDQFPNMGVIPGVNRINNELEQQPFNWAGMLSKDALSRYKNLHKLGIQHKNFYGIRFYPYKDNLTKNVPLIEQESLTWLATDTNVPLIQLDTESKRVGHFTTNHVTGSQSPESTITFIETANNDITNSIKMLRNLVCRRDGTQALPAEYCFWLDVWTFNRKEGRDSAKSGTRSLVFISQANLETAAAESDALLIPITFTQARPFMGF